MLRAATEADLAAINDIYNHYVLNSTCTYQEEPESPESRRQWFQSHGGQHPVIVAEADGLVVGWGSLSSFHPRSAFRHTVENSVYVHPEHQGRGIGSLLLQDLIARARALGHRAIIAAIDAGQAPSIAIHAKFHFQEVGRLRQVGLKFGRWLDVVYLELPLDPVPGPDPGKHPDLNFPAALTVTEQTIDISGFTPGQKTFYQNLFWETAGIYQAAKKPRVAVGLAGPTGAGKSVIGVLFKELAKQAGLAFKFEVVTIDAYHYPNRFLLSHFSGGEPLQNVKGRYDTYDVPALSRDLQAFAGGARMTFPAYSRKLHDPVPDSISVTEPATLLMVEGLWLLFDQSGWEGIRPLLDFCFFIESDQDRTRQAVIKRHMTGGRSYEDAARHYEHVDGRNSELVLPTRQRADKILPPYYLVQ
jgi:phosphinothricin acetyltransferase